MNKLALVFHMMASCSRPAKEVEGESANGPNWLELPRDVTMNILQKLSVVEIVMSACQVCPLWWNICKDPLMWRKIDMMDVSGYTKSELVKVCRYAVERSCGLLEDVRVGCFVTDDLLKYIAESASQLRCLRLPDCGAVSDEGWMGVAKNLPRLEELDISCYRLSKDSLEAIGLGCPLLKALTLDWNLVNIRPFVSYNDEAFAIAKTMPELHRLQIKGNLLTNEGLLSILVGCPLLEYLDLGHCSNVDLSGTLGKRCREQIKEIRIPINHKFSHAFSEDDSSSWPSRDLYPSDDDIGSDGSYGWDREHEGGDIFRLNENLSDDDYGLGNNDFIY